MGSGIVITGDLIIHVSWLASRRLDSFALRSELVACFHSQVVNTRVRPSALENRVIRQLLNDSLVQ